MQKVGQQQARQNHHPTSDSALGTILAPAYYEAMFDDLEELAALQRLVLMFLPEAERAAFMASCLQLRSIQDHDEADDERRLD